MAYRFLYLVRHGQYNHAKEDEGELTLIGEEQAIYTARALMSITFHRIHYSTLLRAAQTMEIIARMFPGVELRPSDLLRECVPSVPPRLAAYYARNGAAKAPTPEHTEQCSRQLDRAFERYFVLPEDAGGGNITELMVAHGNVIRYFVIRALGVHTDKWVNMDIHNCSITRIIIDQQGEMVLSSHNDIGHLPEKLRTHT